LFHVEDPFVLDALVKAVEEVNLVERDLQEQLQGVIVNLDILNDKLVNLGVKLLEL